MQKKNVNWNKKTTQCSLKRWVSFLQNAKYNSQTSIFAIGVTVEIFNFNFSKTISRKVKIFNIFTQNLGEVANHLKYIVIKAIKTNKNEEMKIDLIPTT